MRTASASAARPCFTRHGRRPSIAHRGDKILELALQRLVAVHRQLAAADLRRRAGLRHQLHISTSRAAVSIDTYASRWKKRIFRT